MTPAQVVPGVSRLGTKLVNWYLVEDEGRLTAVDAGLPGFRRSLEADLRSLGYRLEQVEAVVLTHSDSDHTGLTPALRAAGARVLIHSADEATLRNPRPKGGDARPINLLRYLWRPQLWRSDALGVQRRHRGLLPVARRDRSPRRAGGADRKSVV